MCTGLEIAALAAMAAGTGVQAYSQDRALKKQDAEAARNIANQAEYSRQSSKRVGDQINAMEKSNPDADRAQAQAGFMDALRKAAVTGEGGLGIPGAASARFNDEAGIAKTQGLAENARTANQLARIDAPVFQRQREGTGINNTVVDLSRLQSRSQGDDFLSRLRASMIQPNAAAMAGGQLLQGFGSAASMRAPVKKPVSPAVTHEAFHAGF
jgi:hypothetical protein